MFDALIDKRIVTQMTQKENRPVIFRTHTVTLKPADPLRTKYVRTTNLGSGIQ